MKKIKLVMAFAAIAAMTACGPKNPAKLPAADNMLLIENNLDKTPAEARKNFEKAGWIYAGYAGEEDEAVIYVTNKEAVALYERAKNLDGYRPTEAEMQSLSPTMSVVLKKGEMLGIMLTYVSTQKDGIVASLKSTDKWAYNNLKPTLWTADIFKDGTHTFYKNVPDKGWYRSREDFLKDIESSWVKIEEQGIAIDTTGLGKVLYSISTDQFSFSAKPDSSNPDGYECTYARIIKDNSLIGEYCK